MTTEQETQYCVTAMIDLQGFSSHLEVGSDLRTNIGQAAIARLETLREAKNIILDEINESEMFTSSVYVSRINDALILSLDLPKELTPSIGEAVRIGISYDEFEIDLDRVSNLMKFLGLVSRTHTFISEKENQEHFPGVKTIVCSGYRKPFDSEPDDFLAANFSFSNAYIADSFVKGAKLFVDSNILQMLSYNPYSERLLRLAAQIPDIDRYDPLAAPTPGFTLHKNRPAVKFDGLIFRRVFTFYEQWPRTLAFLQLMPELIPALSSDFDGMKPMDAAVDLLKQLTPDGDSVFQFSNLRFDLGSKGLQEMRTFFGLV